MRRVMWQRARVVAVAMMLAACGSEPSPADGTVGVDTTAGPREMGADAATVSSTPDAETTAPAGGPVSSGVTIGPAVDLELHVPQTGAAPEARSFSTRTIALADEFLELSTDGAVVMVSRSADGGVTWTAPVPTDLDLDWIGPAATNGQEVFVSSGYGFVSSGYGASESSPPAVSVSGDGGSTWATSALPIPGLSDSPYVILLTNVSALAATDTVALALGSVLPAVDWQQYSIDALGVDHGQLIAEGGDERRWDVTFEDGDTVSVDPSALGLADVVNSGLIPMAWVRTGSEWEAVDLPFVNPSGDTSQLVVGPAGFVMLPPPAEPLIAVDGSLPSPSVTVPDAGDGLLSTLLYRSTDGRTWHASEPPRELADGEGTLAAGPLGYVVVGETAMWFSTDAIAWSGVVEYEDNEPEVMGWLSAYRPAGGPAGFAVSFGEMDWETPNGAARVLVSSDGRTWEPVPLPAHTIDAMVAVGPDTILVRPVVATTQAPVIDVVIDTSVIPDGIGGAGGRRPVAMCEGPESVVIAAYDLETGAYRWHHCGRPLGFYWLEAATQEAVYVRDVNLSQSDIWVFDAATGEELDSVPAAELELVLTDEAARPATTPPETPGLTVTGGQDDRLIVSDAAVGDEIWSAPDFLAYDDVWAVGDGAIFMKHHVDTMLIGPLRAYELETGDIRWETPLPVESYPWWVADGRVFSIWTELTVLATDTGEVLWTTDYGTQQFPGMRGVLANDNTVFVSFVNGWGSGD